MSWLDDTFRPLAKKEAGSTRDGMKWLGLEDTDYFYAGNFAVAAVENIRKQDEYIERLERKILRLEVGKRP